MKIVAFIDPRFPDNTNLSFWIPPYGEEGARLPGETDDELLARWQPRTIAPGTPHRIIEDTDIPLECRSDRTWRNCLEDTGSAIQVNMEKARVVHMDKIRVIRNAELVKKDLPSLRAIEAGDTDAQATLATEKQVLRDLPTTFDITTDVDTPEKLKAKWPAELPARE